MLAGNVAFSTSASVQNASGPAPQGCAMEVSAWWVLGAFFTGGYLGALIVALITMASTDGGTPAEDKDGGRAEATPIARITV